ncbi:MAG: hypothetical protein ABIT71_16675 [Vicinamibacteraceae bacterium]
MAKKKTQAQTGGDTLGDIAAGLGSLLGNAEKQWRAWQGPRDVVVQAVTDVRDRAVALLSEMDVAGLGSKKGKKKDKKAKEAAKAEKKAAKAGKPGKADKKAEKAGKKAEKAGKKADKKNKKAGKSKAAAAPDAGV